MGHEVDYWAPQDRCHARFKGTCLKSGPAMWDQYVLFPLEVKRRLKHASADTLFVFFATRPWALRPLVKHRPHVVHAHDLLALRSALGLIPQNPTSWSGRLYQRYIRWGFSQARHFIAVSTRTERGAALLWSSAARNLHRGLQWPELSLPTHGAR